MDLTALIINAHRQGRASWPEVRLGEAEFAAWIGAAGVQAPQLRAHGADLFLAVACTRRDPAALAALERQLIARVPDYVARFNVPPHLLDELRQRVRIRLLTGDRPRIADYRGLGPLGAWLRMCA